jgi:hypothetical protein
MFVCYGAQPQSKGYFPAIKSSKSVEESLFSSSQETAHYLTESLKSVRAARQDLAKLKGRGTNAFCGICLAKEKLKRYELVLSWLSQHSHHSAIEMKSKYPTLLEEMHQDLSIGDLAFIENSENWPCHKGKKIPNLLDPELHKGRLGQVIDEIIGIDDHSNPPECQSRLH